MVAGGVGVRWCVDKFQEKIQDWWPHTQPTTLEVKICKVNVQAEQWQQQEAVTTSTHMGHNRKNCTLQAYASTAREHQDNVCEVGANREVERRTI
jgi:hypothetical protein